MDVNYSRQYTRKLTNLFLLSREQHALLSKRSALRANGKSVPGTKTWSGCRLRRGVPARERVGL